MAKAQVGIQMYTFRDLTDKDLIGTLKKVADMGYKAVEFAGFFGNPSSEVKKALNDFGLQAPSAHMGLNFNEPDKLEADLAEHIQTAKEIGLEYVITPWAPIPAEPTIDDVEKFISTIDKASKQVTAAGLKYGYHNHDFEFKKVDGVTIIDRLLERIPADRLVAEFDLGWVHVAGYNPADYVNKYAGRVPVVHFKDFAEGRSDTEIGRGKVDFESVLNVADDAGIRYIFVEQEQYPSSSLESAAQCIEFFKARGMV